MMFRWWRRRRRARNRQRYIYRYFNGVREIDADPMAILRLVREHEDLDADIKVGMSEVDEEKAGSDGFQRHVDMRLAATERLVQTARVAFGVPVFAEHHGDTVGLTEGELLDLLDDFGAFLTVQKKSTRQTPTSPLVSEPKASPRSPMSTSDGSASTSTPSEQKHAAPMAS